jgi:hypothetical protein
LPLAIVAVASRGRASLAPKESLMSASRSRSRSSSRRNKKKASSATTAIAQADHDGIDYGPARAAIGDLANWAFDLAERDVEDWPVAKRRVKNVRRSILAEIGGERAPRASLEDLMFTANLIARVLDADLGLDVAEALAVLDYLALPTEELPLPRPPTRPSRALAALPTTRLVPARASRVRTPTVQLRTPPPLRFCDDCGYVHEPGDHIGYRNAA